MKKKILLSLLFVILATVSIANPACFRKKKPVIIHDTIIQKEYVDRIKTDSVYITVYHDRYITGDTVYIKDTKEKYKYQFIHDSIFKTDTVIEKVPVVQTETVTEVKKVYLWWPSVLILVVVGGAFYYLNKKFKWIK